MQKVDIEGTIKSVHNSLIEGRTLEGLTDGGSLALTDEGIVIQEAIMRFVMINQHRYEAGVLIEALGLSLANGIGLMLQGITSLTSGIDDGTAQHAAMHAVLDNISNNLHGMLLDGEHHAGFDIVGREVGDA